MYATHLTNQMERVVGVDNARKTIASFLTPGDMRNVSNVSRRLREDMSSVHGFRALPEFLIPAPDRWTVKQVGPHHFKLFLTEVYEEETRLDVLGMIRESNHKRGVIEAYEKNVDENTRNWDQYPVGMRRLQEYDLAGLRVTEIRGVFAGNTSLSNVWWVIVYDVLRSVVVENEDSWDEAMESYNDNMGDNPITDFTVPFEPDPETGQPNQAILDWAWNPELNNWGRDDPETYNAEYDVMHPRMMISPFPLREALEGYMSEFPAFVYIACTGLDPMLSVPIRATMTSLELINQWRDHIYNLYANDDEDHPNYDEDGIHVTFSTNLLTTDPQYEFVVVDGRLNPALVYWARDVADVRLAGTYAELLRLDRARADVPTCILDFVVVSDTNTNLSESANLVLNQVYV